MQHEEHDKKNQKTPDNHLVWTTYNISPKYEKKGEKKKIADSHLNSKTSRLSIAFFSPLLTRRSFFCKLL